MEKNLLPIGVANTRPNFDYAPAGGYSYNQDTLFSNVFFEIYKDSQTETQKVFCIQRPGISSTISWTVPQGSIGLGCFAAHPYNETNILYAARYSATTATVGLYNGSFQTTISGIGGVKIPTYHHIKFKNIGMPDDAYTIACTGKDTLYLFKGATAGFTSLVPIAGATDLTEPVYLDNRVFVGSRDTGEIFQSDEGDYTTFSPSDFLTVESYGGKLVSLSRYNNFVVAFKEYSTEFYENVANQNGNVLGRVGQAIQQVGCVHPNTIVDTTSGELIWLATDESGNHTVVKLTNSFQLEPIQDAMVAKFLNLTRNYNGSYAFLLNANGHQFYVLTLKENYLDTSNANDAANVTLVYDLTTGLWTHWYTSGQATSFTSGAFNYQTLGRWAVAGSCRSLTNTTYVQDHYTGSLHQIDDSITYDYLGSGGGVATIPVLIRIANLDLGTNKRKFLNKLSILCDGVNDAQTFTVQITRNDSGAPNTVRTTLAYPHALYALGQARRFTIAIVRNYSTPMRVSAINLEYDVGDGSGLS